jgi:hypothetical protein
MKEQTNKAYSQEEFFVKKCEEAGVKPTKRQASKFRLGKGSAYKKGGRS